MYGIRVIKILSCLLRKHKKTNKQTKHLDVAKGKGKKQSGMCQTKRERESEKHGITEKQKGGLRKDQRSVRHAAAVERALESEE